MIPNSLKEIKSELQKYDSTIEKKDGVGYIIYHNGTILTACPTLDDVKALFVTDKDINDATKKIAKRLRAIFPD